MKSQKCAAGFGSQLPPDETHVWVYFLQQGSTVKDATAFFNHYMVEMWENINRYRLENWKKLAWAWMHYRT
jgi:hypothetical protein